MDGNWPKKYSSRKELIILAATFARNNNISTEKADKFLLEVHKLKSHGRFSDDQILLYAYLNVFNPELSDRIRK